MSSAPKETSHPPLRRTKSSPKIISIYRSAKGERKLQENYDAALQELTQLPFPVEETTVNTAWGKAYVLVAGPEDGIPLFVWQGTATPAPFMLGLFHSFVPKYRVYVPDVPSQGKIHLNKEEIEGIYHVNFKFAILACEQFLNLNREEI